MIDLSNMGDLLQLANLQTNYVQGGGAGPTRAGQDIVGNDLAGGITQLPGGYEALTPEGFKQSGEAVQSYTRQSRRDFHKEMALVAALAIGGAALGPGLGGGANAAGASNGAAAGISKGAAAGAKGAAGVTKGAGIVTGAKAGAGGAGLLAKGTGAATKAGAKESLVPQLTNIGQDGLGEFLVPEVANDVGLGSNILGWEKGAGIGKNLGGMFGGLFKGGDNLENIGQLAALLGGAGAASGGNWLSDALGFTNRDMENMLKGAKFTPPGVNLPGGAGGTYDPTTNSYTSNLGDLNPIRKMLLNTAGQEGPDQAVQTALRDFGLGGIQGTSDVEAQQLALLRERAAPMQQRRENTAINDLFSRGRYGQQDSASGEVARGLAEARSQEDLGFQLAARDLGLRTQDQRFGQSLKALGLGDDLSTSSLSRLLSASGGTQDLGRYSGLPLEMMMNLGIADSNAQMGVGTNLVNMNQNQPTLGDLFGRYLSSRGSSVNV